MTAPFRPERAGSSLSPDSAGVPSPSTFVRQGSARKGATDMTAPFRPARVLAGAGSSTSSTPTSNRPRPCSSSISSSPENEAAMDGGSSRAATPSEELYYAESSDAPTSPPVAIDQEQDPFEPYAPGYTHADVAKYDHGSVWRRAGKHVGMVLPVARGTAPPPGWEPLQHTREELSPRAAAAVRAFQDGGMLSPTARRRQAWLAACAATKDKAHAAKDAKRRKKKKAKKPAEGMITEVHDAASSRIQAVERGRAARELVREMRQHALQAGDRRVRYMPKMKPTLHWQDQDDTLAAPAMKLQAAARRRLARRQVQRLRQEQEEERQRLLSGSDSAAGPASAPAVARLNLFWDSHGNPLPAWLDSLPSIHFSLNELKEIRALRKISTVTEWSPRCNGDYYVATVDASGLTKKARPFRLLLRAWEPSRYEPQQWTPEVRTAASSTPEPATPDPNTPERPTPECPTPESLTAGSVPGGGEDTPDEGEGGGEGGTHAGTPSAGPSPSAVSSSTPHGSSPLAASPLPGASSAGATPVKSPALAAPGPVKYGHIIEVVAVLNHPAALGGKAKEKEKGKEKEKEKEKDGKPDVKQLPIRVVRARRPKVLAANAPDQRTFRGKNDPQMGITSYRGGPDGRGSYLLGVRES